MKTPVLIPNDREGIIKNLMELIAQYKAGNIECCFIGYMRKNESLRTYCLGADNPHVFKALEVLKHDLLNIHSRDSEEPTYYEVVDEEEGDEDVSG